MKIGGKVFAGMMAVAALSVITAGSGLFSARTMNGKLATVYNDRLVPLQSMLIMTDGFGPHVIDATHKVLDGSLGADAAAGLVATGRRAVQEQWQAYTATVLTPEEKVMVERTGPMVAAADTMLARVEGMLRRNDVAALERFAKTEMYPRLDPLLAALEELGQLQGRVAREEYDENRALYGSMVLWNVLLCIVSVLLAAGAATWLARMLSRRLEKLGAQAQAVSTRCVTTVREAADAMAAGNFDLRASADLRIEEETSSDEIGALSRQFHAMTAELQRAAASFNGALDRLNALSTELGGLVTAAQAGNLDRRADAGAFQGDFGVLLSSTNAMLDAVVRPIAEASQVLERLSQRDLTARMEGSYQGDFAAIKSALNAAATNLDEALSEVSVASEQVASASDQISAGSQTLAEGASEQASALEEVSSSLQEMASMTRQNAANAREARVLADAARTGASRGVESMQQLSAAIGRIKESSDATARIVKTIDEIAFQTNLLALNAAVEAARAGDAGKGFAVVAEEVRNLAMRSAQAAKNTADLIEEAVRNAEGGVELNADVLAKLQEIDAGVNKVGEVMAEIAAASEQQTQGVDQITVAVDQMNGVTQATAANSEESASAAEELSSQAARMRELVDSFRLNRAAGAGARQPAPSAPRPVVKPVPAKVVSKVAAKSARGKNGHGHGNGQPANRLKNGGAAAVIPLDDDDLQALGEF